MSYQVLARKWRPRSFETLVGQEHVVRALTHALEQQRLHHAYLFTGTRGVGKTTIARILAKSLNCETGITPRPCGKCAACTEIDAGRFVDLIEVDAATNTKVDEMRQLLENAVYSPTRGRFKVYVIDEVHMLSTSAFNAMLKTLEEPPAHIKFILATTDPQKIPVTVLSRCLQFNLKQMASGNIVSHLTRVLGDERIDAEPEALRLLAQAARGSMRDALSLLDQAIAYAAGAVTEDSVRGMLGTVDQTYLFQVLEAVAAGDAAAAMAVADDLEARSTSFEGALADLATLLHRVALAQMAPAALADDLPERERIAVLGDAIDAESVQLYYQIAIQARQDLALAPDEYAGFTMAILRMLAFAPEGTARPARAAVAPTRAAAPVKSAAAAGPAAAGGAGAPPASVTTTVAAGTFDGDWPALVRRLPLAGLAKQLGERCELVSHAGNRFDLVLPPDCQPLAAHADKLKATLSQYLGRAVTLQVSVGEVKGNTVSAIAEGERRARHAAAAADIDADPFVQALVSGFDGRIESVKPAT
jgi:DNA polymerase-3 subunit gamma/tau